MATAGAADAVDAWMDCTSGFCRLSGVAGWAPGIGSATRRNGDLLGIPFGQLIGIIIGRHKFLPFLVEEAGGRAQPASSSIDYSF